MFGMKLKKAIFSNSVNFQTKILKKSFLERCFYLLIRAVAVVAAETLVGFIQSTTSEICMKIMNMRFSIFHAFHLVSRTLYLWNDLDLADDLDL